MRISALPPSPGFLGSSTGSFCPSWSEKEGKWAVLAVFPLLASGWAARCRRASPARRPAGKGSATRAAGCPGLGERGARGKKWQAEPLPACPPAANATWRIGLLRPVPVAAPPSERLKPTTGRSSACAPPRGCLLCFPYERNSEYKVGGPPGNPPIFP